MDINYLLLLQNFREATGGMLDAFFEIVTKLGETTYVLLFLGAVYWCIDKEKGIFMMFALYTNRIANGFLKITACVYRPWIRDARITPVPGAMADATGYSFPSGHTANAASVWGSAAVLKNKNSKFPTALKVFFGVLVFVIAFSRNYLGVHTPQDVVVALVLAAVIIFLVSKLTATLEKNPNADIWVLIAGAAICALLIVYAALKKYPADYDADGKIIVDGAKMALDSYKNAGMGLGFLVGWFVERRFIKFSTDVSVVERVARFIPLSVIYLLLDEYMADFVGLFASGGAAKAITQFLLVLYFSAGAPLLMKLADKLIKH